MARVDDALDCDVAMNKCGCGYKDQLQKERKDRNSEMNSLCSVLAGIPWSIIGPVILASVDRRKKKEKE